PRRQGLPQRLSPPGRPRRCGARPRRSPSLHVQAVEGTARWPRPSPIRTGRSSRMPPIQRGAAATLPAEDAAGDFRREFAFSDADFRGLAKLAYEHAGIALADSKRNLVYSRLSRRLRALGMGTFQEYRQYLAESDREIESFINSISTNHTKFFREAHHF